MTEQASEARKPKKQRSPSYPAIDLDMALRRARQLWDREGRHDAPVRAILEAWDYGPRSSGGLVAIGALKRFGLLEDKGSMEQREARLTEFGQAIILDERDDSTERQERIREAALKPAIHREIWDKYEGKLPSDSTLGYHLTVERGFTPAGADEFIRQFRRTLEFARLTGESASLSPDERDSGEEQGGWMATALGVQASAGRVFEKTGTVALGTTVGGNIETVNIPVPLLDGGMAVVSLPRHMSEAAWRQMLSVLDAFKPALTGEQAIPLPVAPEQDSEDDKPEP